MRRCARNVARIAEMKTENKILVRKPEGKRPLGRLEGKWG
jgi:hypothetical protein